MKRRRRRGGTSTVVKPENQLPITPLGKAPTLRVRPTEYNGSYGVVHRDSKWVQFVVISIHRNFKHLIFLFLSLVIDILLDMLNISFLTPLCGQFVRKIIIHFARIVIRHVRFRKSKLFVLSLSLFIYSFFFCTRCKRICPPAYVINTNEICWRKCWNVKRRIDTVF